MKKKVKVSLRVVTYDAASVRREHVVAVDATLHVDDNEATRAVKAALGWETVRCRQEFVRRVFTVRPMAPEHKGRSYVSFVPMEVPTEEGE